MRDLSLLLSHFPPSASILHADSGGRFLHMNLHALSLANAFLLPGAPSPMPSRGELLVL